MMIEYALKPKEMIEEKYGCTDFIINIIGCAIGTFRSRNFIVFFLNEKYEE